MSSKRFNTDEFESAPPRAAVEEMLRPKRARMFRSSPPSPGKPSRLEGARKFVNTAIGWAAGLTFIFTMLVVASYFVGKRETAPAPAVVFPTPRPSVAPAPTPALVPPALAPIAPAPPVRRAELAVKRAQFVGLPVGWTGNELMPDGSIVPVRYMGEVGYFDHLPRNPSYGDMWKVTSSGAAWVWTTPAGFAAPAWVDP
jgi:hypothetical protein